MQTFYFNTGVKPWNTNVQAETARGNKFINNELNVPFDVEDVPEGAQLASLCSNPDVKGANQIMREVFNTTMCSKYAFFNVPKV